MGDKKTEAACDGRSGRGAVHFALFLALLCVTLGALNFFCVKRDSSSALPLLEIMNRDDVDLVFVGSSVVRNAVNPELIDRTTGLCSFDLSIPGLELPGAAACIRLAEEHNALRYAILMTDPEILMKSGKGTGIQRRIWPYLRNPADKAAYYLDLCRGDGQWIEHLLVFQHGPVESWKDFRKTWEIEKHPEWYLNRMNEENPDIRYEGRGFMRVLTDENPVHRLRTEHHPWHGDRFEGLSALTRRRILELSRFCRRRGTQLIVAIPPAHPLTMLSLPAAMEATAETEALCAENGIRFWDFTRMRPEAWPDLQPYFYDLGHMSGTGADIFSEAFGTFFARYMNGEDVSGMFYPSWEEYMAEAPMVNAWMDFTMEPGGQVRIFADFNGGTGVEPQYRFCVIENGAERILRDYVQEAQEILVPAHEVRGKKVRVYIRDAERPEDEPVYCTRECP